MNQERKQRPPNSKAIKREGDAHSIVSVFSRTESEEGLEEDGKSV
jgi:hypothetical protein